MNVQEITSKLCEEGELWKPCPEFEEKYLISSHGRVLSIGTYNTCKKGKLLSLHKKKNKTNPTVQVQLFDSGRMKTAEVHILVAKAFIPNPDNLPIVTHLDGNNSNNHVDNLEWRLANCRSENYYTKKIDVYNSLGILVKQFNSIKEASLAYNVGSKSITECCKSSYKFLKGLQFRYKGEPFQTKMMYENTSVFKGEEWRPIPGYENYQVSSFGRVKNSREWLLKCQPNNKGYLVAPLHNNNHCKTIAVHRLVALAFLPNPNKLASINHKDEDKTNNHVENLEWCTAKYNTRYSHAKGIKQYDTNGNFIRMWEAISDIESELGIPRANISKCCKGEIKTINGFVFLYPDGNIDDRIIEIKNRKHKSKTENKLYELQ